MKKSDLIKVLEFISNSYPGKFKYPFGDDEKDSGFEETWLSWFSGYEYETVMMVLRDFLPKNSEWPPTPMQIIERIKEINEPEENRITPEEAWEEALNIAVGSSCHDTDLLIMENTPDKIKRAVSAVGGLEAIRMSKKDDPFFRKSFIEAYSGISERLEHEPDQTLIDAVQDDIKQLTNKMRMLK